MNFLQFKTEYTRTQTVKLKELNGYHKNATRILDMSKQNNVGEEIFRKNQHKVLQLENKISNVKVLLKAIEEGELDSDIQNNYINVLPAGVTVKYDEVAYPIFDTSGSGTNVDIDDTSDKRIPYFPDEAVYLVVLYGAMKTLVAHIGALEIPPNVSDNDGTTETLTSDMDAITGDQLVNSLSLVVSPI